MCGSHGTPGSWDSSVTPRNPWAGGSHRGTLQHLTRGGETARPAPKSPMGKGRRNHGPWGGGLPSWGLGAGSWGLWPPEAGFPPPASAPCPQPGTWDPTPRRQAVSPLAGRGAQAGWRGCLGRRWLAAEGLECTHSRSHWQPVQDKRRGAGGLRWRSRPGPHSPRAGPCAPSPAAASASGPGFALAPRPPGTRPLAAWRLLLEWGRQSRTVSGMWADGAQPARVAQGPAQRRGREEWAHGGGDTLVGAGLPETRWGWDLATGPV